MNKLLLAIHFVIASFTNHVLHGVVIESQASQSILQSIDSVNPHNVALPPLPANMTNDPPPPPPPSSSSSQNPTPTFTFRPALPSDAPLVSSLLSTTWSKHFAYSVSPSDLTTFLSGPLSPQGISSDIANPANRFILAFPTDDPARLIGVAQLVYGTTEECLTLPDPVELRRIYVDTGYHGSGAGKALMFEAQRIAREGDADLGVGQLEDGKGSEGGGEITQRRKGAGSIWLGVWEDNVRGKRFYEKEGFEIVGEHIFLVGESRRRDWIMQKAL